MIPLEIRPFKRNSVSTQFPHIVRPHIPSLGKGRFRYLRENEEFRRPHDAALRGLRNLHEGRRAFILGNGPSIAKMDLSRLKGEVVFGVNGSYNLYEKSGFVAPYTCFTDRVRWHEIGDKALDHSPGSQFFYADDWEFPTPHTLLSSPRQRERVLLLDRAYKIPKGLNKWNIVASPAGTSMLSPLIERSCREDILSGICLGNSVIFAAVQIAAYMGCRKIYILGVDMDYSAPQAHFHNQKVWVPPMDYEKDAKPWFVRFRSDLEARGIEFINATTAGRVDCLKRAKYDELF